MDNITHGLLGAAIGMLRRRDGGPEHDRPLTDTDKAVVWASFLAAELPDIDVFFGGGPMESLVYHRGWTHALLLAPLVAGVATAAVKLVWRRARTATVYAWSIASLAICHLFADWLTGWGTRLLLPFSDVRAGLDWVPIVDWVALLALAAGVITAYRKPRLRHRLMVALFSFIAFYWIGYRGLSHTLVERYVAEQFAGQPVAQMRVAPNLFNPLGWQYTVDLGDRYVQGSAYPWQLGAPDVTTPKPPEDAVTRAVRSAPELKPFFDHFAYPLISYTATAGGFDVTLVDVRYQMAGRGMEYKVSLTPDLKVARITD